MSQAPEIRAQVGEWLRLKSDTEFSPSKRYGHSAVLYEPATTQALNNLKANLRPADINQRGKQDGVDSLEEDTQFMVVFGGKNAEIDVLFNDIFFLGDP